MASSLFQSVRGRRNANGMLSDIESTIEDQIASLREEIGSLSQLIGKNSRRQGERVRSQATEGYEELLARGEDLLNELHRGYRRGTAEVSKTVRRHPLATVGAAAAVGLAVALLARR
ncbi:hypothetical protein [Oryzifoliimicrobium ureilyticus]|uniref:hypothetical protein n=1 Tax=Oryzifoliimicrobium ureilyticus TaxID=3113724 RepID=UPI0030766ED2